MSNQQIVNDVISKSLRKWGEEFVSNRVRDAGKINQLTGKGQSSFKHRVKAADGNDVAMAIFEFAEYLRYHDMRNLRWSSSVPNIDAMKDFITKVGIGKFKGKFVAKHGFIPKKETDLLNRLAWGIGLSIYKRGKWKTKRTRWYNKQKERDIHSLYGTLLNRLSKESLDQIKKELK